MTDEEKENGPAPCNVGTAEDDAGLKITTARSVLWSASSLVGGQLLSIAGTAVLARFLLPSDFGIVGIVAIVTGLVTLLGNFGLGAAIIYRKEVDEEHIATSYWFNVGAGALLTVITIGTAPLAARFFHNEMVRPVACALSLNFLINSFSWAHGCLLRKDLRFRTLAIIQISTVAIRAVTAITLAVVFHKGVWALVAGDLAMNFAGSTARFFAHPWKPSFRFRWSKFKELFHFGINLTGAAIFDYFSRHIDFILIGKLLDSTRLGFYQFSYSVPHTVQTGFTSSLNRVLFPVYCRVQDDNERFGRGLVKALRVISLAGFPFLTGLAVVAAPFVRTLYGERWEPVILPLRILCFSALARSILATNGAVLNAKGRPDIGFKWSMVRLPLTFVFVYLFSRWGVVGIAAGVTIASFASLLPAWIATRLIELPFRRWLGALVPAAVCSSIMVALLLSIRLFLLPAGVSDIVHLAALVPAGVAVYVASFFLIYREYWNEIADLARGALRPGLRRGERR